MGAFNRKRIHELHELWDRPRIDGKTMYEYRSSKERIDILRQLNLDGSEVLRNGENPDCQVLYYPKFCYLDGILCCEIVDGHELQGYGWSGKYSGYRRANLLPQLVDLA